MDIKNLPEKTTKLAQTTYDDLRYSANSFMNRNWWWVVLAAFGVGIVLGLWNPAGL